ncbi:fimbrial protein [Faunimonas sp. B44]|uniref:fimbrial protein n=1 Tax=Faunimonas sp. B44 TaxID=3461493 RepID=UPI004043E468
MAAHDPAKFDEEEPPLDPAAERVRQKLARLLLGSLGVMLLGLIAVFAAIVYKIGGGDRAAVPQESAVLSPEQAIAGEVRLPAGAEIRHLALEGRTALLHVVEADGTAALVLLDLETGRAFGRHVIIGE